MRTGDREQPRIAAICAVPLLSEAISAVLDEIAEVQSFPANGRDIRGLLRWLRPDGIVVDTQKSADDAEAYARAAGCPLVHVQLPKQQLRVLADGRWKKVRDASAESIRNALVGSIYGARTVPA